MAQFKTIVLSKTERERMQNLLDSQETDSEFKLRIRIILSLADGVSTRQTAKEFKTHKRTVAKWRNKYFRHGLSSLGENIGHTKIGVTQAAKNPMSFKSAKTTEVGKSAETTETTETSKNAEITDIEFTANSISDPISSVVEIVGTLVTSDLTVMAIRQPVSENGGAFFALSRGYTIQNATDTEGFIAVAGNEGTRPLTLERLVTTEQWYKNVGSKVNDHVFADFVYATQSIELSQNEQIMYIVDGILTDEQNKAFYDLRYLVCNHVYTWQKRIDKVKELLVDNTFQRYNFARIGERLGEIGRYLDSDSSFLWVAERALKQYAVNATNDETTLSCTYQVKHKGKPIAKYGESIPEVVIPSMDAFGSTDLKTFMNAVNDLDEAFVKVRNDSAQNAMESFVADAVKKNT